MKILGFEFGKATAEPAPESRANIENPTVPVSAENFLAFFGVNSGNLPAVTIDTALTVPAFACGVSFLAACLASIPLNAYRSKEGNAERINGGVNALLNEAPNDEWTSFAARKYFWTQVFTGGRGMLWIEWAGNVPVNLWPMDPAGTTVVRRGGRKFYNHHGKEYPADEVIDVPFLLKRDQLSVYSPVVLASKALQLALAMNDYGSNFFAGGGVPPLALEGPMPAGADAVKRAQGDIKRAIDASKANGDPVFPIPAGYKLNQVGFDPSKGQMVEARLFQIQEIARVLNLPPVFLQDLSRGTFSNVEQQDLHLVKHTISQWAKALEEEINLKLFGRRNRGRFAEHNLDGLMRGDFMSRMVGLTKAVAGGILEPNRARGYMNWPEHENPMANDLFMQGATVPLGTAPAKPEGGAPPKDDENGEGDEPGKTDSDESD